MNNHMGVTRDLRPSKGSDGSTLRKLECLSALIVAILGCMVAFAGLLSADTVREYLCERGILDCTPVANFSAYPECGVSPLEVSFVNKSSGDIDTYRWDFDDGTDDTRETPRNHRFQGTGVYEVELVVSGPGGTASKVIPISVNPADTCIVPTVTPTSLPEPTIRPTNTVQRPDGPTQIIRPTDTWTPSPTIKPTDTWTPTDTPPIPQTVDLIIESVTYAPATPTTADTITFTAIIRNSGPGVSAPTTAIIKVGGETFGRNYSIQALSPGQTATIERQENLSVAQNYGTTVTVDPDNLVTEINENNNSTTVTFAVTAATSGKPFGQSSVDLVIDSVTHTPPNPTTGDTITFTAVVRNAGSSASNATTVIIKVGGETFGQNYPIPALNPGQTATLQRQETLSVAQNYMTTVIVDPDNTVLEIDENNNTGTVSFQVTQ